MNYRFVFSPYTFNVTTPLLPGLSWKPNKSFNTSFRSYCVYTQIWWLYPCYIFIILLVLACQLVKDLRVPCFMLFEQIFKCLSQRSTFWLEISFLEPDSPTQTTLCVLYVLNFLSSERLTLVWERFVHSHPLRDDTLYIWKELLNYVATWRVVMSTPK